MKIIVYPTRPPQRLRRINWNGRRSCNTLAPVVTIANYLLPYPVLGAAQVGDFGGTQPVGEAVMMLVLVYV